MSRVARTRLLTPLPETARGVDAAWPPESGTLPSARRPSVLPPAPPSSSSLPVGKAQTQMPGRAGTGPLGAPYDAEGPSSAPGGPSSRPAGPAGPPVEPGDYGPRAGETAAWARRRRSLLDAVVTAWRSLRAAGVPNDVILVALRPITAWASGPAGLASPPDL